MANTQYNADSITVLEGLEAVSESVRVCILVASGQRD